MRAIIAGTIRGESAALAMAMTSKAYAESKDELAEMNWPKEKIRFSVATLSLGPDIIGNTLQDERYYEDVLMLASPIISRRFKLTVSQGGTQTTDRLQRIPQYSTEDDLPATSSKVISRILCIQIIDALGGADVAEQKPQILL